MILAGQNFSMSYIFKSFEYRPLAFQNCPISQATIKSCRFTLRDIWDKLGPL